MARAANSYTTSSCGFDQLPSSAAMNRSPTSRAAGMLSSAMRPVHHDQMIEDGTHVSCREKAHARSVAKEIIEAIGTKPRERLFQKRKWFVFQIISPIHLASGRERRAGQVRAIHHSFFCSW